MVETIEVGYKPVIVDGVNVYHKYILYTNSQGDQFYARGGPGYFGPGATQGGMDEASFNGMGLLNAQSVINNANFGQTAQTLNNPSVWQAELVKMA